ncbi:NAD-dependent epimerase/dehydratase family protein [Methanothrix soehngenii]|uniref:NAD-dependent epimerase/dehydratase family protein n=1 Tax=Methanothrix soehngenii TaxID=2223 RepID=UPI00373AE1FD
MLFAARDCGAKKLVYASSSAVYGDEPARAQAQGPDARSTVSLCCGQDHRRILC